MKFFKKMLTGVSTVSLALLCTINVNAADSINSLSGVNPIYKDVITLESIQNASSSLNTISATEDIQSKGTISYAKAKKYLRKALAKRQTTVKMPKFYCPIMIRTGEDILNIMRESCPEDSSSTPIEGDYLWYHIFGFEKGTLSNISVSGSNFVIDGLKFNPLYSSTAKEEQTVDKKFKSVIKRLNLSDKTDYEKVKAIYKYIVDHIEYDFDNLNYYESTGDLMGARHAWAAYGGLCLDTCVCQAYSTIFHRFCDEINLSSRVITGEGGTPTDHGPHAWNIVKLNGKYYNVDATWDAYDPDHGIMRGTYDWFLLAPAKFIYHDREPEFETGKFHKQYPMAKKNYDPKKDPTNVKYSIKYVLNGGKNNSKNPSVYNKNTPTIKLKDATRSGYTFKGWYSDKKCTKKVTSIKKGSTGNKTLYAKWAKK